MDKMSLIKKFIMCPACKTEIEIDERKIICKKCGIFFNILDNDIPDMLGDISAETYFSMSKWDALYQSDSFRREYEKVYRDLFLNDVMRQVFEYMPNNGREEKTYLEIGCGLGFLGEELAKKGWLFIGVDFSINALMHLKKRLDEHGIGNYLLIRGDIQSLSLRHDSLDLLVGSGTLEHFKNTEIVLGSIFNSLRTNGVSFNIVPLLNIGNLVYRSLWGSIPNVIILKQIAELIHLKLLKGKHMSFGYELQFTRSQLRRLHINAGFRPDRIFIDRFDCYIQLHKIGNEFLRQLIRMLCRHNRQFWPMVKVIGIK